MSWIAKSCRSALLLGVTIATSAMLPLPSFAKMDGSEPFPFVVPNDTCGRDIGIARCRKAASGQLIRLAVEDDRSWLCRNFPRICGEESGGGGIQHHKDVEPPLGTRGVPASPSSVDDDSERPAAEEKGPASGAASPEEKDE